MKVIDHLKFAKFEYTSHPHKEVRLGDVLIKTEVFEDTYHDGVKYDRTDISIGVVLQTHEDSEFRTDMWGNGNLGRHINSSDEIRLATIEEIKEHRPQVLYELEHYIDKDCVIGTWAPVFGGFYDTMWEMDDEGEYLHYNEDEDGIKIRKELGYNRDVAWDDFEYDNKQYCIDVCKSFVDVLSSKLSRGIPSIDYIIYEELRSPKYYNYETDAINIQVILKDRKKFTNWIRKYLKDNAETYAKYLQEKYTSRDGFISSYPSYIEGWKEDTKNYTELDSHYLGSLLVFYCKNEGLEELDDFYNEVMERICVGEYMTLKPCEDKETVTN